VPHKAHKFAEQGARASWHCIARSQCGYSGGGSASKEFTPNAPKADTPGRLKLYIYLGHPRLQPPAAFFWLENTGAFVMGENFLFVVGFASLI
jgi:hypothetical protein